MILSRLRSDLDLMPSPVAGRPGLLMRDTFRYAEDTLIIPPPWLRALEFFDGIQTSDDLQAELEHVLGPTEARSAATMLVKALSEGGFLEDETYARLRQSRHESFAREPVRKAAFAGSAYPGEPELLRQKMQFYLKPGASPLPGLIAIAAPHVSPEGGWQSYRAAYQTLAPDLSELTFVVLGTSHYGEPGKFGLTRKPFETPLGTTTTDNALVQELEKQPAALVEDYCHAVEHSIEFQVLFLQAVFGPGVRILPILCGSFGRSIYEGRLPEEDPPVGTFFAALAALAKREERRLFWVLGVDMAHMGVRYGDNFEAFAEKAEMTTVRERDRRRLERLHSGDSRGFWDMVIENGDDLKWCGSAPFYTFMKAVPQARGTLQRYEQWNIDEHSVVTFAGISFHKCPE